MGWPRRLRRHPLKGLELMIADGAGLAITLCYRALF